MTVMTEVAAPTRRAGGALQPFTVNVPVANLEALRLRICETRWPEREQISGDAQGVQLTTMQKLARYWATDYNWRTCEARLNAYPQFVTKIHGLDIHFIHARSKHANALPLIITHGWPGSIVEHLRIIESLTDPTAHGGSAAEAFDVVIPSLPGYGFSGKPAATGWDASRIARAWVMLMQRLDYAGFVAWGEGVGNAVTQRMALLAPPELLGIHTNASAADQGEAGRRLMSVRPQTLYGIVDSPIGLAAWLIDHDAAREALVARVFDGQRERITRDDILDNITLYWLTNTGVSSARLFWNDRVRANGAGVDTRNLRVPVIATGEHCAAREEPERFVAEMRASFKTLRSGVS